MTKSSKPVGTRALKERLKSKKQRTKSSKAWLERQLNDPYVRAAKAQGFRSRAAYKLKEMDDKFHFLKKGMKVVDLGAAPRRLDAGAGGAMRRRQTCSASTCSPWIRWKARCCLN
jgi:hypothetical protein